MILEGDGPESADPVASASADESYTLTTSYDDAERVVRAVVGARSYFGARHAVETLFQMMEYDEAARRFLVLSDARVEDRPEFAHRGVSLDVSRNFYKPEVIK